MIKPEYELSPLKAGILQCDTNILAFRQGIQKEEERITEYQGLIAKWEEYNRWLEDGNITEPRDSSDNGNR